MGKKKSRRKRTFEEKIKNNTEQLICPYCGEPVLDAWEMAEHEIRHQYVKSEKEWDKKYENNGRGE